MKTFALTERQRPIVAVVPRVDKIGNVTLVVEYQENDGTFNRVGFKSMSSIIDFISTNFNSYNL